MNVGRAVCLGILLTSLDTSTTTAACTPGEFQGWFHAAEDGALTVPEGVRQRARGFRYVFVAGFANERMPGYFAQSEKELRALGVPAASIHVIVPSSRETSEVNCDDVRSQFLEIAARGPERLVVIGHSRGACDALAFALQNEGFVRDRVEALFLVQGAFGGSGAADYLMGEGLLMDRRMPLRLRVLAYMLAKVEGYFLRQGKHGAISGLTRGESGRFWDRLLREHADALAVVGPKTFYVTGRVSPSRLRLFRRAIASYLEAYYGPNDGVVALRDQSLPGLGTCLGVFDAGHMDLTHRFPATRAPQRMRKALVQSIVMAVGGDGEEAQTGPSVTHKHRWRRRVAASNQ